MNFSSPMDPMGHRIAGVHALSIQFGRGVKWGSDAPGLWRVACHLPLFLARQDRADYYARKGIQVRQAVTLWEVKTDVACPIKKEKALPNNQMRDTNKTCKDDSFGIQSVHFPGCSRMQCPKKIDFILSKIMWSHRRPHRPRQDPAREWASMQEPLEEDDEEEAATHSRSFAFFSHRKLTAGSPQNIPKLVPKGKPSTQTSHFWGSIAVSWLGGLVGRLKNERGNCVGP